MFTALALLTAQVSLSIGAALSVGRRPGRQTLTGIILLAGLALPFKATDPIARVALTLLALMAVIKCVVIVTSPEAWRTPVRRIWQVLVPFDVSRTHRVAPGIDFASTARIVTAAAVVMFVAVLAMRLPSGNGFGVQIVQIGYMLVGAYSLMELSGEFLRSMHRAAGVEVEPLQKDPILARTVTEFWGERWNMPVTRWLNQFFFRPLIRKGHPLAGIVAAFLMSAILHAWLFYPAIGWQAGLMAGTFFLVQIPAILLERRLQIKRWPAVASHVWTLTFLVATSPLFLLPMIQGLRIQMELRGWR